MPLPPLPSSFNPAAEFPILNHWLFFNHAGVAPIAARSAAAIRAYADISEKDAYMTGKFYKQAEHVRKSAARLINADPAEIAFTKNTSEGIAFVANGLAWNAGDEIISTAVEYPANVYPWMELQQRLGTKHIMLPEKSDGGGAGDGGGGGGGGVGRIPAEDIFAAVTPRTRMIALSHVEYASGYRHDLTRIGQFCRERNILLCIDGIQSCGVLPVDVRAMNIDFLSADGHKWMLGAEGLGIFYCRRELIPSVRPEVGWMNVINATDYGNFDFTLRDDAKRFECGSYNIPGVLGLGPALDLLLEIGIETVWARVNALNTQLAKGLEAKGYQVFSPRQTLSESSGIISFSSPVHSHDEIVEKLEKQRIIIVQREKRLRASPHFYQDESHIHTLLEALPNH